MKKKFLIFSQLCVLCLFTDLFAHENQLKEREEPLSLTTSVIVPCHHSHFKFLEKLLDCFSRQILLPDEVVISLSEAHKVEKSEIDQLNLGFWPFSLQIVCTNEKRTAGENRNIACKHARGELLIFMDADDIPHDYRIKITKYFFEKYQIDLMLHKFVRINRGFSLEDTKLLDFDNLFPFYTNANFYFNHYTEFHNGHPSLLKTVFNEVQCPASQRGQDVMFINEVLEKFDHVVCYPTSLTLYRMEYSTWINKKNRNDNFTSEEISRINKEKKQVQSEIRSLMYKAKSNNAP